MPCHPVADLPGSASVSRLLAATDRLNDSDESVSWLLAEGSACRDLLRSTLGQARDALGSPWSLFDFDPTVDALRQRALAELPDTPEAKRRPASGHCRNPRQQRDRADPEACEALATTGGCRRCRDHCDSRPTREFQAGKR